MKPPHETGGGDPIGIGTVRSAFPTRPYGDHGALVRAIDSALRSALGPPATGEAAFSAIVPAGSTVLLKPNWVAESNRSHTSDSCICTHSAFLVAAVESLAAARPGRILIGDAPIQGCRLEAIVTPSLIEALRKASAGIPVEILDFRRTITKGRDFVSGVSEDARPMDRYVPFDLGTNSYLEPVSAPPGRFRVTEYNPTLMNEMHRPGRHQYFLCKELFEADVVISLPKLKTHCKSGLTGALKNLVGLNGNKECLPHHRLGGSAWGGDCYRGRAPLKRVAEWLHDQANYRIGTPAYRPWFQAANGAVRCHLACSRYRDAEMAGAWYGNDTVWRMALDLNRIALYGDGSGRLQAAPQRRLYHLTDAIVCGEGDGPLRPNPRPLGLVTFSTNGVSADLVHAFLMHFDWRKIPIIREAYSGSPYPLVAQAPEATPVAVDGELVTLSDVARHFGFSFRPPAGWMGDIEHDGYHRKADYLNMGIP